MGRVDRPVLNFGAGPSKLPPEVLKHVQNELTSYGTTEMSVMEISHRSKEFEKINSDAQAAIKELLQVPDNYKILFMQGGGTGAFATIAMNLINRTGCADYAVTGIWSDKAAKEAAKYGKVNLVFPKAEKAGSIPEQSTWKLDPNASYLYYCANETIEGVEFPFVPETNGVPLVSDMSSSIMTKKIDVSKFGVIFGGAQKNIGIAGVTVLIIRENLIATPMSICPSVFDFSNISKQNSIYNTPVTFSVYVMEQVFQWVHRNGGVVSMERLAKQKSQMLYEAIEKSNGYYSCHVDNDVRSRINVPFRVGGNGGNEDLEAKFVKEAELRSMYQLKGHRLVGGIRVSLFNAVTVEDVQLLIEFMEEFQRDNPVL